VEENSKIIIDLFGKIADLNNDPLIVIDESYEIVFTNQVAISHFIIDDLNISLEQIFENESVKEITDLIGITLSTAKNKSLKDLELNLKSGVKYKTNILIEILALGDKVNIVLIFKSAIENHTENLISKIKIGKNPNISGKQNNTLALLQTEIKNLIPFSLISLNRLQAILEKYNFPILVKDTESKLIGINSSYANFLGVEISLAVGKKLEAFLPPHQKVILQLLDEFTITNKQQIIFEGFSKKIDDFDVFQSIIQIPLLDNLNNIYAIIGLIVDNKQEYSNFWNTETLFDGIVESLPDPIAIVSVDGVVKNFSNGFSGLLKKNSDEIADKRIDKVFNFLSLEDFNSFIKSSFKEKSFILTKDFIVTDSIDYFISLKVKKVFDAEENTSHVLMILGRPNDDNIQIDEFQNILLHRGKMFDILIQKNPEPIFIYDKENLRFLEVNNAAVNLYGFNRDEFLQMDLTDLYAPEDIQTLLDSFGDQASESRFSKPFRHRKKDGTNVLVEISKTSFTFNDREAHFNIVKDITSTIETSKQNQMLKAIFAETDLMVFNTDASGFITFANLKSSDKLGYKNDELIQSSFASLVVDEDRGLVNTSIFQSYLKDTIVLETKFKLHDGDYIDAEIFASPIFDFDGEIDSFTVVVKTQQAATIETEPKEIVKEVIREVVKEVVVEKPIKVEQKSSIPDSNFLSGMFHEILTPINVIIGFSQELISSTQNPTEEQIEASEIINQNRLKMMDTMNSVVEYSDIAQNKSPLKVEDISITEVIEKLDNNIKDITGINDIQFAYGKISSSLKFKTDRQKFESFILSLIKVVSRLSKEKKIYFSAFPIDTETFLLGISDQYGNPSEYVSNILEQVFINDRDPKDFGLPKLTSYLSRTLLSFLSGKFYRSSTTSLRPETGFLFPFNLSANTIAAYEPFVPETIIEEQTEPEEPTFKTSENEQQDLLADSEIIPENESQLNNEPDIFMPSVSDEDVQSEISLNDITSIQTEEEYFSTFANEVVSEEIKTDLPIEHDNIDNSVQENLAEEIKHELEAEPIAEKEIELTTKSVDLTKLNCLYIEDQIDSQILFKVQMKGLNDIKFAASFEDAQLLLLNHQFDFIVMDINLQGEYNGLDALKIIKTMPAFSSIPIISVTAYVLPGDKEKFIAAGFDDFISKPIFREKMMESLEKIFLSK